MKQSFKPENYNSLSPYFVVDGVQPLIDLLKQIFGAVELRKHPRPNGSIMHAEIKIDDTVIMLGGATEDYSPNAQKVHLYVTNVDAVFKKALEYGCETIQKPKKKEGDEDKRGAFKDYAGNSWWIATQLIE